MSRYLQRHFLTPMRTVTTRLKVECRREKKLHSGIDISFRILFSLICLSFSGISQAEDDPDKNIQPVYGAGPSTKIVSLFFDHFSTHPEATSVDFIVPERSTKHAGGIRASNKYLFGRTGRPLVKVERAENKFEILLARVPIGFATGSAVTLPPLKFPDIENIISGQITNWADLGGPDAPVVLLGREKTETVLMVLSEHFPSLVDADYPKILKRDHAVVNFLNSPVGKYAIGYGAISNFSDLNIVELQGPPLGINVGLVVDRKNQNNPMVQAVEQFAYSSEWRQLVESAGYFAVEFTSRHH